MAFDQGTMKRMALRLIGDAGTTLKFKHIDDGVYDPATGNVTQVETQYDFTGAIFNYSLRESGQASSTMLIEANDRKLIVYARDDGVMPSVSNWKVKIENNWWTVITIRSVAPAGVPVYHEVQARLK